MAILPRPVSPRAAWSDLRRFLGDRRPHQLVFAALALFFPAMLVWGFYLDSRVEKPWEPPDIVYVTNYSPTRTRAEIAAQQAKDLPAERAERKRIETLKAKKRSDFKRIDKQMDELGI